MKIPEQEREHFSHAVCATTTTDKALLERARAAQKNWGALLIRERLRVLRRFRSELALGARDVAATVPCEEVGSLSRTLSDTLVAEVLPLAEACRFLERESEMLLAPRVESGNSRPWWLRKTRVETARAPLGVVLVIGPANYPLFLPGVQVLQALAAGNAILWKPAGSGVACAQAMRLMLVASGLPADLVTVLEATPQAAVDAIRGGVDKVFLTGSAETGRTVLQELTSTLTPSVMELSGCDAVFVLPGADLRRVTEALTFGLHFNGSATCMAPRRIFVHESLQVQLAGHLAASLERIDPIRLSPRTLDLLREAVVEALLGGAHLVLDGLDSTEELRGVVKATLLTGVTPQMRVACEDLFAPILSLIAYRDLDEAVAMHGVCPLALTASVFGEDRAANKFAARVEAGTVLINDLIVSTADPRVSFGGRRRSGFGVTRGPEGLLAMTAPRVTVQQRSKSLLPYQKTTQQHSALFAAYVQLAHAKKLGARLQGVRALLGAIAQMRPSRKFE